MHGFFGGQRSSETQTGQTSFRLLQSATLHSYYTWVDVGLRDGQFHSVPSGPGQNQGRQTGCGGPPQAPIMTEGPGKATFTGEQPEPPRKYRATGSGLSRGSWGSTSAHKESAHLPINLSPWSTEQPQPASLAQDAIHQVGRKGSLS